MAIFSATKSLLGPLHGISALLLKSSHPSLTSRSLITTGLRHAGTPQLNLVYRDHEQSKTGNQGTIWPNALGELALLLFSHINDPAFILGDVETGGQEYGSANEKAGIYPSQLLKNRKEIIPNMRFRSLCRCDFVNNLVAHTEDEIIKVLSSQAKNGVNTFRLFEHLCSPDSLRKFGNAFKIVQETYPDIEIEFACPVASDPTHAPEMFRRYEEGLRLFKELGIDITKLAVKSMANSTTELKILTAELYTKGLIECFKSVHPTKIAAIAYHQHGKDLPKEVITTLASTCNDAGFNYSIDTMPNSNVFPDPIEVLDALNETVSTETHQQLKAMGIFSRLSDQLLENRGLASPLYVQELEDKYMANGGTASTFEAIKRHKLDEALKLSPELILSSIVSKGFEVFTTQNGDVPVTPGHNNLETLILNIIVAHQDRFKSTIETIKPSDDSISSQDAFVSHLKDVFTTIHSELSLEDPLYFVDHMSAPYQEVVARGEEGGLLSKDSQLIAACRDRVSSRKKSADHSKELSEREALSPDQLTHPYLKQGAESVTRATSLIGSSYHAALFPNPYIIPEDQFGAAQSNAFSAKLHGKPNFEPDLNLDYLTKSGGGSWSDIYLQDAKDQLDTIPFDTLHSLFLSTLDNEISQLGIKSEMPSGSLFIVSNAISNAYENSPEITVSLMKKQIEQFALRSGKPLYSFTELGGDGGVIA